MKVLKSIFKDKELSRKCLATLLLLIFTRMLASIPAPGTNPDYFKAVLEQDSALGLFNMLTGNGLSQLSIVSLSITPYITASIIIQLLGVIFPKVHELYTTHDKSERKKLDIITILTGAALALAEGAAMAAGFGRQGLLRSYTWYWVLIVAVTWTLGAALLSVIGKIISDKFIGNGISLILVVNILSGYPSDALSVWNVLIAGHSIPLMVLIGVLVLVAIILVFGFVYIVQECERRVHVNYSAKYNGKRMAGAYDSVIPIKMCPGGVVPIIFASTLLTFPVLIANALGKSDNIVIGMLNSSNWFRMDKPIYTVGAVIYIVLIFLFSFFYMTIQFSPHEVADNIKKAGGTIAGIRPGKPTADYLMRKMRGMVLIGCFALTIIALIPLVLSGLTGLSRLSFLGTSIIITVGVIAETGKLLVSNTKGSLYMEKVKKGGLFHHALVKSRV